MRFEIIADYEHRVWVYDTVDVCNTRNWDRFKICFQLKLIFLKAGGVGVEFL